jgi:hypothetical protein
MTRPFLEKVIVVWAVWDVGLASNIACYAVSIAMELTCPMHSAAPRSPLHYVYGCDLEL